MLRTPLFYCLLDSKYIQSFLLSFLLEITLTNIYLNLNGLSTPKVPKCVNLEAENGEFAVARELLIRARTVADTERVIIDLDYVCSFIHRRSRSG